MRRYLLILVLAAGSVYGQSLRGLVNKGVEQYDDKKYPESEINFKKGLETAPNNFQAEFNLGDSYFRQQRYDEAVKAFQQAVVKTDDKNLKARSFHNIGNSLLKAQKLKESVDAYKKSLKLNPYDQETKYNLSYALNLLKNQQNQNQQNQNQQNQNDKNQDKNKQDQQNQQNQNDQNQNKDQNKQQNPQDNEAKQDQTKQDKQQSGDKQKMSKQEAERILNAIKNNEQELQNKLRKHKGKRVPTEKDW